MLKKHDDQIDYTKLNEGISIGTTLLKIFLVLAIACSVYLISKILIDWNVFGIIGKILSIISPFFIGLVIAWLFDPLVKKITDKGVSRTIATVFVYVIFLFIIFIVIRLMIPSVSQQINDLVTSVPSFINFLNDSIDNIFDNLTNSTGYDLTDVQQGLYTTINDLGHSLSVDLPSKLVDIGTSIIQGGINLLFGLLVGFYMLFDFNNVNTHLMSFVPKKHRDSTKILVDRLNENLRSFVQGTLRIMLILFVFQSVALAIAGLKAPMVFGLFCAITNVIPYVGPYIGGIPTVLVGFSMSPAVGFGTLIAVVIAQILESYFLQPLVMGKTMKLHPVTIMIGLLVFGNLFGIIGMILATPTISVIKTIVVFLNEKYSLMERFTN